MSAVIRTAVIVNPASASGRTGRESARILDAIRARIGDITVLQTGAPRDAAGMTRKALRDGHDRIVSVGGDGTHLEVTNGFFDDAGHPVRPDAIACFLPHGTGSDLSKSLRLPKRFDDMLDLLASGPVHTIDVIRVEIGKEKHRFFFQNIARAGAGAEVVRRANQSSRRLGGFLTFMLATLRTVATYGLKPMTITIDGETFHQDVKEFVVAQGQYDGGGMRTAPYARLDNALADVYVYGPIKLWDAFISLRKIYTGTMMDRPDIVKYFQAKTIKIDSPEEVWLEADGELLGTLPATFTVIPRALRVLTGKDYTAGH